MLLTVWKQLSLNISFLPLITEKLDLPTAREIDSEKQTPKSLANLPLLHTLTQAARLSRNPKRKEGQAVTGQWTVFRRAPVTPHF